jgi:hypothetical protein
MMEKQTTTSQKAGLVIFSLGAILMVVLGFLASWWFVPAIRAAGFSQLEVSGALSMLWGLSAPLGAILIVIGGALYASAERSLIIALILGSLIVIVVSAAWPIREPVPPLFGVVGGLITLFYIGLAWNWIKERSNMVGLKRSGSDLTMIGATFFVFASWYLCGLLGAPTFALRPELMEEYQTAASAASLGSLIAVYLAFGWGFLFFGQRITLHAKSEMLTNR